MRIVVMYVSLISPCQLNVLLLVSFVHGSLILPLTAVKLLPEQEPFPSSYKLLINKIG